MQLKTRIHEWAAQHIKWIPYPDIRPKYRQRTFHPLAWQNLSGRQKAWILFAVFWISAALFAWWGNSLD